ncbi:hypothetical protein, partial [Spirochaeta lutea]|uniref:hypothetical protein n=1 Tax=Spirochaeta lutea TaxID=1480694 RepID=UPI001EE7042C
DYRKRIAKLHYPALYNDALSGFCGLNEVKAWRGFCQAKPEQNSLPKQKSVSKALLCSNFIN